jgi:putative flippase GtrA
MTGAADSRTEFIKFVLVGAIGFAVEAATLQVLVVHWAWGVLPARAISFPAAVTVTWALNRAITFRHRRSAGRGKEYGRYIAVQVVGAAINLCVYAAVVGTVPSTRVTPVIPLALGAAVGLIFNFLASRGFVFARRSASNSK